MRASQAFNAGSIPVTRSKFSTQSMLRGSNPGGPEAAEFILLTLRRGGYSLIL